MSQDIALLDANIFYPAPLRDLFMQLAVSDLFQARWTAVHRARLERTREMMDLATRDCPGYQHEPSSVSLTTVDDRHVLAAAVTGRCTVIVTWNLVDFPKEVLEPFGIEAQDPDSFLAHQLSLSPDRFCAAVRKVRQRLKNPPYTTERISPFSPVNGWSPPLPHEPFSKQI
ncbi:MAG: hypothetical protein R2867_27950 [Caldilineaceae bacterium]